MKICPVCKNEYNDSKSYCMNDGAKLVQQEERKKDDAASQHELLENTARGHVGQRPGPKKDRTITICVLCCCVAVAAAVIFAATGKSNSPSSLGTASEILTGEQENQIAQITSAYEKSWNPEVLKKIPSLLGIPYGFGFVSYGDFNESMSRNNIFIHEKTTTRTPLILLSGQGNYCSAAAGQSKKYKNPIVEESTDITQVQLVASCNAVNPAGNNYPGNLIPDIPIALIGPTSVDYERLSLDRPILSDKDKIGELEQLIARNKEIKFFTFDPKSGMYIDKRPPLEKVLEVKHDNKVLYFMFYKDPDSENRYNTTIIMVNDDKTYQFYPGCHGGIYLFELDHKLYLSYFYAGCDNGRRGKELYVIYGGKPILLYRNNDFAT